VTTVQTSTGTQLEVGVATVVARPDVPRPLAEILQAGMAKDAAARPRTGTAFAHLLRAAASRR